MSRFFNALKAYNVIAAIPFTAITMIVYIIIRIVFLKSRKLPRKSFGIEIPRCLLAGYIAALAVIVLSPKAAFHELLSGKVSLAELRLVGCYTQNNAVWRVFFGDLRGNIGAEFELFSNVVLFIPFGFLLPICFRRLKWWAVDLVGLGTTLVIEAVQPFLGRTGDLDDIIANVVGMVFGCAAAKLILILCKKNARHSL